MIGRRVGLGGVKDGGCGWVASYGRANNVYGWCHTVGRSLEMGGVKW